jgi:hypothetical protein
MKRPLDSGPVANVAQRSLLSRNRSERVDFGSGQGLSDVETAGVAGLRRGFPERENAGRDHKMPVLIGHYLAYIIRRKEIKTLCQSAGRHILGGGNRLASGDCFIYDGISRFGNYIIKLTG